MSNNKFQRCYGKIGIHSPATHQQQAWMVLAQGKSVIIRAPTGSGKTEAIILPYLANGANSLPARLIYALPLRSLANQIVERIRRYARRLNQSPRRVALQHGEAPESVLFTADVVVATIDQVITSYACAPLTLPVRHGNIPAGAVMSSFVVFDEVHLFDPELALQATRLICERLHRLGLPYAVLSATLPDSVVEFWQRELGAQLIDGAELVSRQVNIQWHKSNLTDQAVHEALQKGKDKIIAVCNTVERAIQLFQAVQDYAHNQGYQCQLLHSRFLSNDRKHKEDWVEKHFGKNAQSGQKALLVATQVVEVGLDISCDLILTEVAPVDALIQRAGRCKRWGGEGEVWVFEVDSPAPYQKGLVDRTREVLQRECPAILDWNRAKSWVNAVLDDRYRQILEETSSYEQVVAQLSKAAFKGERALAEAAVRDVNTVEVTIHSDPASLGKDVLRLPTISVHIGVAKEWLKQSKKARRVEVDRSARDEEIGVNISPLSANNRLNLGDRLVFPPTALKYSPDLGLHLGTGNDFTPRSSQPRPELEARLLRETWIDHAVVTVQETCHLLAQDRHAVRGLAQLLNESEANVRLAAYLAAFFHDFGKLTIEWQSRAGILETAGYADLLAHTDRRVYAGFPPHATVSAYALRPVLESGLLSRTLGRAVFFAIAHHHSVRAKGVPKYCLHPSWQGAVQAALNALWLRDIPLDRVVTSQESDTDLPHRFPPLENDCLYTAYVLISRWLRLADRKSTGGGEDAILHYENWFGRL